MWYALCVDLSYGCCCELAVRYYCGFLNSEFQACIRIHYYVLIIYVAEEVVKCIYLKCDYIRLSGNPKTIFACRFVVRSFDEDNDNE